MTQVSRNPFCPLRIRWKVSYDKTLAWGTRGQRYGDGERGCGGKGVAGGG